MGSSGARRRPWRSIFRLGLLVLVIAGNALLYAEWWWREAWPLLRLESVDTDLRRSATGVGLPPSLVRAVAIEESKGDPSALSEAGARGLMQLRLETAREMARALALPEPEADDLYDPRLSLRLGCAYLSRLLDRFGGDLTLALAAYNGGPTRVARWLKSETHRSSDDLVQARAPKETREFVARVRRRWRRIRFGSPPGAVNR